VDVAKHVWNVLQTEGVTADKTALKVLIDAHYPDIRKILNECQLNTIDGVMSVDVAEVVSHDHKLQIVATLSEKLDPKAKFTKIRQIVADARIRDFADAYRLLYDRVTEYSPNNVSGVILAIGEGMYKDSMVVDKEINFMAAMVNILQAAK
jgi:hypothetical protein